MAITVFDETFLKEDRALIDRLMDDQMHRRTLLGQLSKNNADARTWFQNVRSHLAISECKFQNICINV